MGTAQHQRAPDRFEYVSNAVCRLRSTPGRHRRLWRHTRFCLIAAETRAAAGRRSGTEQSEDRSLKFPDERSAYRVAALATERLVYDKASRSTVALFALGESDCPDKDAVVATDRPALFCSVVSADDGKRLRRDGDGKGERCRAKLDASTSDLPHFSVAIYADFTEAALDGDLLLNVGIAMPMNSLELPRNSRPNKGYYITTPS